MRRLATFFLLCMTGFLPATLGGQEDAAKNPWIPTEKRAPGLSRRIFPSKSARTEVGFHVWLPPAYAKEPTRRFPVLYWLHGSGGGIDGVPQLARRFDAAVRAGKIPDLIVVFPWGLPEGMWLDARNGGAPVESVVIGELLPYVDREFRTIDAPRGRLLEGFSMGGYGAGHLGFRHPHLFGAVSMLAGGPLHPEFETRRTGPVGRDVLLKRVYGDDMNVFRAYSPWHLADPWSDSIQNRPLRIVVGARDETADYSRMLHERLDVLRIPHTYTEVPGVGHQPLALLEALGDDFWKFHRDVLGRAPTMPSTDAGLLDTSSSPKVARPAFVAAVGPEGTTIAAAPGIPESFFDATRVRLPRTLVTNTVAERIAARRRRGTSSVEAPASRAAASTSVADLEAASGVPWSVLLRRELGGPLDLNTLTLGSDGEATCSLADATRFAAARLRGRSGDDRFLPNAAWDRLFPAAAPVTTLSLVLPPEKAAPASPRPESPPADTATLRFDLDAGRARLTVATRSVDKTFFRVSNR